MTNSEKSMKKKSSLLDVKKSVVIVVDMQTQILNVVNESALLQKNAECVIEAASWLEVPLLYSEQYPKGLGGTQIDVKNLLNKTPKLEKTSFSLFGVSKFKEWATKLKGKQVVLVGVETHVCILQTALEMIGEVDCQVYAVVDAMGSRSYNDHKLALERMQNHGVELVSTEMVLMEWLRDSKHKDFKVIQGLIK